MKYSKKHVYIIVAVLLVVVVALLATKLLKKGSVEAFQEDRMSVLRNMKEIVLDLFEKYSENGIDLGEEGEEGMNYLNTAINLEESGELSEEDFNTLKTTYNDFIDKAVEDGMMSKDEANKL